MELSGFEVGGQLFSSDRFVIHRGHRLQDQQPVLLKVPVHADRASEREALEREFDLLHELAISGIPRAYELARGPGGACLVLEDRGYSTLAQFLARGQLDVTTAFRIAIELCTILDQLHGHQLIHGGVSPACTLVSNDGTQIQLVPIGITPRASVDARSTISKDLAPYVSPEQTGRNGRVVDHRTDFYSLGAMLYEALTGAPPFQFSDPEELIQAHLARTPATPVSRERSIPASFSRLVVKLLAKAPEDRYYSALAVKQDLERCESEWSSGRSTPFELGQSDVATRLVIPQKLYGRDRERGELVAAFEDACKGSPTFVLVSGPPGSGTTSLVRDLSGPVAERHGHFVEGRFDQVLRDIPYSALIAALRALAGQLSSEPADRLAAWREHLNGTLGASAGVLTDLVPELRRILGEQPALLGVNSTETRNRFGHALQTFVGTLATAECPVVLFLDNMQWSDAATCSALEALFEGQNGRYLMCVCAVSEREGQASPALSRLIERLGSAQTRVRRLALQPLSRQDLADFLRDTMRGEASDVEPLVDFLRKATGGNPFFAIQLLKTLEQGKLVEYDHDWARWSFRMSAITRAALPGDVTDLLTGRMRGLSAAGQGALAMAASTGHQFDWETVSTIDRQRHDSVAEGLAEAVEAGFIQTADMPYASGAGEGTRPYSFLHELVHEGAYGLIPAGQEPVLHLNVGRRLLAASGDQVADVRVFEIVHHLNFGRSLITDAGERLQLARLNLTAGTRAKSWTAYQAAVSCLEAGIASLRAPDWKSNHELMLRLYLEAAECQYLTGATDQAEPHFATLLDRAVTPLDKARVHALRTTLFANTGRFEDAVTSGREGLALFGIAFPEGSAGTLEAIERVMDAIRAALDGRAIGSLVDLPPLTDANTRMIMHILAALWTPAHASGRHRLTQLISATMVRLSLAHGNADDSAFGYVTHAVTIASAKHDYEAAYQWGTLALAVNDRLGGRGRRARIQQHFHTQVNLWRRPFATAIPHARDAWRSGLETGDFAPAACAAATESWAAWPGTRSLDQFLRDFTPSLARIDALQMPDFRTALVVMLNWARALQGKTTNKLSVSDDAFDVEAFVASGPGAAAFVLTSSRTAALHLSVLHEEWDAAAEAARKARDFAMPGTMWPVLVDFWGAIALAQLHDAASESDRQACRQELADVQMQLEELARSCPENFRCLSQLVAAEGARLDGRSQDAASLCEEAIAYAQTTDNLQMAALANELCARLALSVKDEPRAARFMRAARHAYSEWGASAKVAQIEERYARLLSSAPPPAVQPPVAVEPVMVVEPVMTDGPAEDHPTTEQGCTVDQGPAPNAEAIQNVARVLAVEIELDTLLRKLMVVALQNAGAERAVFLQEQDGELFVQAEAKANPREVRIGQMIPLDNAEISRTVVRSVQDNGQAVVLGDAARDPRVDDDEYVERRRPKSILCVRVGHDGRPHGILYLENYTVTNAFKGMESD